MVNRGGAIASIRQGVHQRECDAGTQRLERRPATTRLRRGIMVATFLGCSLGLIGRKKRHKQCRGDFWESDCRLKLGE
jgi:hypothetical protein